MTDTNRTGITEVNFTVKGDDGDRDESYALKPDFKAVAAIETVTGKTIFEVCYLCASQNVTILATALFHGIKSNHPKDAKHLTIEEVGNAMLADLRSRDKKLVEQTLRFLNGFLPDKDSDKVENAEEKKPQNQ